MHENLTSLFTDIADAIREKTGSTDAIVADQFPEAIAGISAGGSTEEEWIGDGNTHIWVSLQEGRTNPRVGIYVKGTITVDWGDGSEQDVIQNTTYTNQRLYYSPVHEYEKPGDYVITLSGDGEFGVYGTANYCSYLLAAPSESGYPANYSYANAIRRVELGGAVTGIGEYAFQNCYSLTSVFIPEHITSIGNYAFQYCYSLDSVQIPDSVTTFGGYAFSRCYSLNSIRIPERVTHIADYAFKYCPALKSLNIHGGVNSIGKEAFSYCYGLASVNISGGVNSIGQMAFSSCGGVRYYDFLQHTYVPTLSATNVFSNATTDCQIRVPASLVNEWKAATNWSTYADRIVGV